jgi:hypothetical protein
MLIKQIVHWKQESWETEPHPVLFSSVLENFGYVIGIEIEVEIGDPPAKTDLILVEIAALRKEQGEHQAAITKLDERIQSLQCIEFKGELI